MTDATTPRNHTQVKRFLWHLLDGPRALRYNDTDPDAPVNERIRFAKLLRSKGAAISAEDRRLLGQMYHGYIVRHFQQSVNSHAKE